MRTDNMICLLVGWLFILMAVAWFIQFLVTTRRHNHRRSDSTIQPFNHSTSRSGSTWHNHRRPDSTIQPFNHSTSRVVTPSYPIQRAMLLNILRKLNRL
jgi:hypothetical protein